MSCALACSLIAGLYPGATDPGVQPCRSRNLVCQPPSPGLAPGMWELCGKLPMNE